MDEALGAMIMSVGIIGIIFIIFVLAILGSIFWIFMLVDAAKRKFSKDDERVTWILVLALLGIIGAIIYYFVIKRKNKN